LDTLNDDMAEMALLDLANKQVIDLAGTVGETRDFALLANRQSGPRGYPGPAW